VNDGASLILAGARCQGGTKEATRWAGRRDRALAVAAETGIVAVAEFSASAIAYHLGGTSCGCFNTEKAAAVAAMLTEWGRM
jgi:hypothetical protein